MLGEYRLGVELHALDGELLVTHAHDFIVRFGPGRHLKTIRQRLALNHQRVIAVASNGLGSPANTPWLA